MRLALTSLVCAMKRLRWLLSFLELYALTQALSQSVYLTMQTRTLLTNGQTSSLEAQED